MTAVNSIFEWLIQPEPGRARMKQGGGDADVQPAPPTPPKPDAEHLKLGREMAELGVEPTKDLYGQGPEEHGSAWKAPIEKLNDIKAWLRRKGFRPSGSYSHKRRNLQVDIGTDKTTVYLYITDDNEVK